MYEIRIQTTENPNIIKFVAGHALIEGALELDRQSNISEIPLAQELFKLPFVKSIFITANFIAVSKEDFVEWDTVSEALKDLIEDQLLEHPGIYIPKKKEQYMIYAEMSPNPWVMKFVSNSLIVDGFLEVKSQEESQEVPLAKTLFENFSFIESIFISDNYIAVTKDNSIEWHQVMIELRDFISHYLQAGGVISNIPAQAHEKPVDNIIQREYSDEEQKINDILNEYVAPAIAGDGGKISLIEYDKENKIAKMLLQGACSGCPSSTATLKNGIENILKQFAPELVNSVEAVNG
ncbi:NifU family protein [Elizabethkingia sp. JS20170427COW]|uniref:NifU family protein n=1 Tax=Elizabethkingia sp. JS20170427COW TaxID=2583851 RepID=UPI0011103D42|nr:NifU family protein [Elizabethkingia sp. JS20170427COW]QCX53465.1 NifU family protein [Elizabethkingia sp. JS20170427COW]